MDMDMDGSSSSSGDEMGGVGAFGGIGSASRKAVKSAKRFVGPESSSSGDERIARLKAKSSGGGPPVIISGRGRSQKAEIALMRRREMATKRLDHEDLMREMDQEDLEEEEGIQEARATTSVMHEWQKVQEARRQPALKEMEASDVKADRIGWKKKTKKKAAKKKAVTRKRKAAQKNDEEEEEGGVAPVRKATRSDVTTATKALANAAADEFAMFAGAIDKAPPKGRMKRINKPDDLKNADELPLVLKYLADFARACIVTYLWGSNQEHQPHEDDTPIIRVVFPNANSFMTAGKELSKTCTEACHRIFKAHNNSVLQRMTSGVTDTVELHLQPTVRKAPSEDTVDVWTGEPLTKSQLRRMSSIVFNPNSPEAEPNSVICSKQPATMFGLLHFLSHFDQYCKQVIHEALLECHGKLDPCMRWEEAWTACVGKTLAKRNPMSWPKTGNSLTEFGKAIINLREWIKTCVWLEEFLTNEAATAIDD
jgi:hypothetical protein